MSWMRRAESISGVQLNQLFCAKNYGKCQSVCGKASRIDLRLHSFPPVSLKQKTDRQTDRQTDREKEREREREREREADGQTDRGRETERQTDRQRCEGPGEQKEGGGMEAAEVLLLVSVHLFVCLFV